MRNIEQGDSGDDDEDRCPVHLAKLGFHMFLGEEGKVFVHDLAPEGLFPVEVADHILRVLCYIEELLSRVLLSIW